MSVRPCRAAQAAAGALLVLVVAAAPASAHIGTSEDEIPAGASGPLGLTVGHGCDDSPTTAVAIQIPEGVNDATAFAKAGWTIESESETLDEPVEGRHGDQITERVATITFTAGAGNELPTDVRDVFTVNFTAPDAEGETLYFKTVQTCEQGANRWIDEWDGEGEEPESPAPSVVVTAAVQDGGHGGDADPADAGSHEDAATAGADDSSDGSSDGLAIAALVVGALGLVVGGVALARTRASG